MNHWRMANPASTLLLLALLGSVEAWAHTDRSMADHDMADHRAAIGWCEYADPSQRGRVDCADAAADACQAGVLCSPRGSITGCHRHSWEGMGLTLPAECAYVPPPPPPPACHDGPAHCDAYGAHAAHDCAVCDERDGTCGWARHHRHPGQCPPVDPPPPPPPQCTCCAGVIVDQLAGETCAATCASLLAQIPDACPANPPVDPPVDPPSPDQPLNQTHPTDFWRPYYDDHD